MNYSFLWYYLTTKLKAYSHFEQPINLEAQCMIGCCGHEMSVLFMFTLVTCYI